VTREEIFRVVEEDTSIPPEILALLIDDGSITSFFSTALHLSRSVSG